jgi:plasmid stabilization system protein ParE
MRDRALLMVVVSTRAEADIRAAEWYEAHRERCGDRLHAELDGIFRNIAEYPEMYERAGRRCRRAIVMHFPFAVVYRVRNDSVEIVRLFAARSHPKNLRAATLER